MKVYCVIFAIILINILYFVNVSASSSESSSSESSDESHKHKHSHNHSCHGQKKHKCDSGYQRRQHKDSGSSESSSSEASNESNNKKHHGDSNSSESSSAESSNESHKRSYSYDNCRGHHKRLCELEYLLSHHKHRAGKSLESSSAESSESSSLESHKKKHGHQRYQHDKSHKSSESSSAEQSSEESTHNHKHNHHHHHENTTPSESHNSCHPFNFCAGKGNDVQQPDSKQPNCGSEHADKSNGNAGCSDANTDENIISKSIELATTTFSPKINLNRPICENDLFGCEKK